MTTTFRVDSEIGRLRRVLLHRPDLELARLTPANIADLQIGRASCRERV